MNRSRAHDFFTEAEKKRLEATVRDAESRTIGEIVLMVVDSSDPYLEAEVIGGIAAGGFISLILTILFFHSSILFFLPLSFLLFFPAQLLVRRDHRWKALLLGSERKEHAVRERALRAFFEKGLYKTKENTGVLFFLSLLERKVWILADKGIYQKIGQETLDRYAKTVSQGVRDGRACDALYEAIEGVGQLLAKHFPTKAGDTDELPDEVITEE
jgi:putative membrane protein